MEQSKEAIIWRKSIYENNMKCNLCGTKLWDVKKNEPTDNLGVSYRQKDRCYCMKCLNLVAVIRDYHGEGEGMMGHWEGEPIDGTHTP